MKGKAGELARDVSLQFSDPVSGLPTTVNRNEPVTVKNGALPVFLNVSQPDNITEAKVWVKTGMGLIPHTSITQSAGTWTAVVNGLGAQGGKHVVVFGTVMDSEGDNSGVSIQVKVTVALSSPDGGVVLG